MSLVGHGPNQGFKVPGRRIAEIAGIAGRVRSTLGVHGVRFNAGQVLESLSRSGITVDVIEDDSTELPHGVMACWAPDILTLCFRHGVYIGACQGEPRALFTVAHELGHLALGHRRTFNRDVGGKCEVYEDSEWQANTFAAEFLMPLQMITSNRLSSAQAIAAFFGVSAQAAETRFNKLKAKGAI